MSNILPPKTILNDIEERFQLSEHTEQDFEFLIGQVAFLMKDLEDEKARNFNLEMDNFFLRGGQIPNQ